VNPRTVVVIQAGSAVLISEWLESVPAVVQSWYAGSQAGPGLADVLFGAVNPSGRLPFSVPINETDLPDFDRDATNFMYDRWHGWWHLAREGIEPLFPFGFGLSYATFEIDAVTVEVGPDGIDVSGSVINLSEVGGADVVQIYARLPDPELPSRLAAFVRVEVAAGARAPFRTLIAFDRLATWNPTEKSWIWLAGQHVLTVSRSARDRFGARFEIDVSTIPTRNERPSATWVLSDQRSLRD
jgi:beta-glucosidase